MVEIQEESDHLRTLNKTLEEDKHVLALENKE